MSSTSRPRLRRLSWTPSVSSWGEMAGCHDLSGGRRAPSFLTITNPAGYGCSACRMIWLVIRAVEVSRVDMVHASRYGFADDSDGAIGIPGRAPYAGASQLHRTVAYPFNRQ